MEVSPNWPRIPLAFCQGFGPNLRESSAEIALCCLAKRDKWDGYESINICSLVFRGRRFILKQFARLEQIDFCEYQR